MKKDIAGKPLSKEHKEKLRKKALTFNERYEAVKKKIEKLKKI